jgi:uncharacterized membrane protein HdeD (DUF308 family)
MAAPTLVPMLEDLLTALISTIVTLGVVALVAGIFVINAYTIVHAWRSERILWAVVLVTLFLGGGGIAAAAYLFWYGGEPLPRAGSSTKRALA